LRPRRQAAPTGSGCTEFDLARHVGTTDDRNRGGGRAAGVSIPLRRQPTPRRPGLRAQETGPRSRWRFRPPRALLPRSRPAAGDDATTAAARNQVQLRTVVAEARGCPPRRPPAPPTTVWRPSRVQRVCPRSVWHARLGREQRHPWRRPGSTRRTGFERSHEPEEGQATPVVHPPSTLRNRCRAVRRYITAAR
jgi:hypothetical protein